MGKRVTKVTFGVSRELSATSSLVSVRLLLKEELLVL